MKKLVKRGALLVVVLCSLTACQEELPTPEDVPSQEYKPSDEIDEVDAGNN